MGRVYKYPYDLDVSDKDIILGSDIENGLKTKNFKMLDIKNYILKDVSDIIPSGFTSQPYATWTGVGLIFDVVYPSYYIEGVFYSGKTEQITLIAADLTNPRLDIIAVDVNGTIQINGAPSSQPVEPLIDVDTQLKITTVLVNANATIPSNIVEEVVYKENVEWTATSNIPSINFNSADAYQGNKCIKLDAISNNNYILFTDSATNQIANYDILKFFIRLEAKFVTTNKILINFYNGASKTATLVVSKGKYNFQPTVVNSYQCINIPLSDFIFSSVDFNKVEISYVGDTINNAIWIDNIALLTTETSVEATQNAITSIITDSGTASSTVANDSITFTSPNNGLTISALGKIITFISLFTSTLKTLYDNTASSLTALLATGSRLITSTEITKLSNTSGTNTGDQNLSGYAPLASPAFTGIPTAPTATAGTNTTQIATTAFVLANAGSGMTLNTAQTFTATKNFNVDAINTPALSIINSLPGEGSSYGFRIINSNDGRGVLLNNLSSGYGISLNNTSSGYGILLNNNNSGLGFLCQNLGTGSGFALINNNTGDGFNVNNSSTGNGIINTNSGTGTGIKSSNESSGIGMILNNTTAATGKPFQYTKNAVEKAFINDAGDFSAQSITVLGTLGLRNVADTFTSYFSNANTASRNYNLQNRNGTLLDDTDLSTINTSLGTKQSVFTGTTNYLPKSINSTTLGVSRIIDNGTYIGIGTANTPTKDFTLGNQANREIGIEDSDSSTNGRDIIITAGRTVNYNLNVEFLPLSQTPDNWKGFSGHPNGNVYAVIASGATGGIYTQTLGTGNFVKTTTLTTPQVYSITCLPNGNLYVGCVNGDIYRQINATGGLVLVQNLGSGVTKMSSDINNNVYAVSGSQIYKITNDIGIFSIMGVTSRAYNSIASHPNGNIYATVANGDIYMQTAGTGDFNALSQTVRLWSDIAIMPNGNVYAFASSIMYIQTNGVGAFANSGLTNRIWTCIGATVTSNNMYAYVNATDIFKQSLSGLGTSDLQGGTLKLKAGTGKGTGQSKIQFVTGAKTASGTDMQVETVRAEIDEQGVFKLNSIPTYADNTTALAGGLTVGMFYRTAVGILMIVY